MNENNRQTNLWRSNSYIKAKSYFVVSGITFFNTINMCDRGCTIKHMQIPRFHTQVWYNYNAVIMGAMASQIIGLAIVYSIVYSGADQRKRQSPASLAFVRGIHRWPVNSPHKWPVTQKMFPFDDVIVWILDDRYHNPTTRKPCAQFSVCVAGMCWYVNTTYQS